MAKAVAALHYWRHWCPLVLKVSSPTAVPRLIDLVAKLPQRADVLPDLAYDHH